MKVFDCFCFAGETNLLELRLKLYENHVDYFIIVESNIDFRGNKKEILIDDKVLKKYPKIRHIKLEESDFKTVDPWQREIMSRNAILRGLSDAEDDDLIILSDIDEIISPSKLPNIANSIRVYELYWHRFFLNYINLIVTWKHASSFPFKYLKVYEPFDMKLVRKNYYEKKVIPLDFYEEIPEAGSHFSYFPNNKKIIKSNKFLETTYDSIKNKLKSFPKDHLGILSSFDASKFEFKLLFYFGIDFLGCPNLWGKVKIPLIHFPYNERYIISKFLNTYKNKTFFVLKSSKSIINFANFIKFFYWRIIIFFIKIYFRFIKALINRYISFLNSRLLKNIIKNRTLQKIINYEI